LSGAWEVIGSCPVPGTTRSPGADVNGKYHSLPNAQMSGRRGQQVTHCQLASTTDVWREYRLGPRQQQCRCFNAAWPWPKLRIPTIWLIGGSSRQRWMGKGRLLPDRATRNASCHDDNCAGRKRLRNGERKNNANRNHGKSGLGTGKVARQGNRRALLVDTAGKRKTVDGTWGRTMADWLGEVGVCVCVCGVWW
jgi:hypothetical protein